MKLRAAVAIGLLAVLTACATAIEPPAPVELRVAASAETGPAAQAIAADYTRAKSHVSVVVSEANATVALAQLAAGEVDLAIVSNLPPGAEQFRQIPIARDGLAIIVHPDNPVKNLTLLELQKLYAGTVYNWADVQGQGGEIQAVVRERGSGARAVFEERVMAGKRVTPNARVFPSGRAVVDFVSQNPQAIGYVSAVLVTAGVKVISVEDIAPAPETVSNGAYPLTHPVYLLTLPEPVDEAGDLADLFTRPAGQAALAEAGFARLN